MILIATGSDGTPGRMVTHRHLIVCWYGYVNNWILAKWSLTQTLECCQVVALCWFSLVHVHHHGWKWCATCDLQTAHLGMFSCKQLTLCPALFLSQLCLGSDLDLDICCLVFCGYEHALVDAVGCIRVCSVWEISSLFFMARYVNMLQMLVLYLVSTN